MKASESVNQKEVLQKVRAEKEKKVSMSEGRHCQSEIHIVNAKHPVAMVCIDMGEWASL